MPLQQTRTILGIDPGTNVLCYGVLETNGSKARMLAMGVIDLRHCKDVYVKLGRIYERVSEIIESFKPDELAIEAPFFGKNVQSMLKLGRAQGVAIAAAISKGLPIHEYAPLKIKMAITGEGQQSINSLNVKGRNASWRDYKNNIAAKNDTGKMTLPQKKLMEAICRKSLK